MHHPVLPSARQLRLAELDAAIGRTEARLARPRWALTLRIWDQADTAVTEALVRRARTRLPLLHKQRFLLLFRGQVQSRRDA
jgi:hypothetical protein